MVTASEQRQIAALFAKLDTMQKVVVDGQTETNRQLSALTTRVAVIETKMPYMEEDIKQAHSLAQEEVTGVHNVGYKPRRSWMPDSETRSKMRNIGILLGAIIGTGAATWIAAGGVSGSTREIDHKQVVEVVRPYSRASLESKRRHRVDRADHEESRWVDTDPESPPVSRTPEGY
jgi:hypothetical protein